MSVYSAQSHFSEKTGLQSMSTAGAWTHQSSSSQRVRRPGAAKDRLAKAKQAEQQIHHHALGWKESMKVAAASTNHVWRPEVGFVNSTADLPDEDAPALMSAIEVQRTATDVSKDEIIHIPIHAFQKKRSSSLGRSRSDPFRHSSRAPATEEPIVVPFPKEWEKERRSMIRGRQSTRDVPVEDHWPHGTREKRRTTEKKSADRKSKAAKSPSPIRAIEQPDNGIGHVGGERCWPNGMRSFHESQSPLLRDDSIAKKVGLSSPKKRKKTISMSPARQRTTRSATTNPRRGPSRPASASPRRRSYEKSPDRTRSQQRQNTPKSVGRPPQPINFTSSSSRSHQSMSPATATSTTSSRHQLRRTPVSFTPIRGDGFLGGDQSITDVDPSPNRSKAWVESMRDAVSQLTDAKSWDPKNGFIIGAEVESDMNNRSGSSTPVSHNHSRDDSSPRATPQRAQTKPEDVIARIIADRYQYGRVDSVMTGNSVVSIEQHSVGSGSQQERRRQYPIAQEFDKRVRSRQNSVSPTRSTGTPADISAASWYRGNLSSDQSQSTIRERIEVTPDEGILVRTGTFDGESAIYMQKPSSHKTVTPDINVVKKKIDDEDVGWFPRVHRTNRSERSPNVVSPANSDSSQQYAARTGTPDGTPQIRREMASTRRCSGPVDLDVSIATISAASDASPATNVWDTGNFESDSFLQGSIASTKRDHNPNDRVLNLKYLHSGPTPEKTLLSPENATTTTKNTTAGGSHISEKIETTYSTFQEMMQLDRATPSQDEATSEGERKTGLKANSTPRHSPPADDDKSRVSSESSVAAGWKSFLKKKVAAEKEAAIQRDVLQQKTPATDVPKIKKTVSFASDSLLSDSLLTADTLFDFSVSDVPISKSPQRSLNDPGIGVIFRDKPKDNTAATHQAPQTSPRPHSCASPSRRGLSPRPTTHSPPPENENSFSNAIGNLSPIPTKDESYYSDTHEEEEQKDTFMTRLAECKRDPEVPVAYQLYLRTKNAAAKVEEMMAILAARGCNPGDISSATFDDGPSAKSYAAAPSSLPGTNLPKALQKKTPEEAAAEEFAKAKVAALTSALFYTEI